METFLSKQTVVPSASLDLHRMVVSDPSIHLNHYRYGVVLRVHYHYRMKDRWPHVGWNPIHCLRLETLLLEISSSGSVGSMSIGQDPIHCHWKHPHGVGLPIHCYHSSGSVADPLLLESIGSDPETKA